MMCHGGVEHIMQRDGKCFDASESFIRPWPAETGAQSRRKGDDMPRNGRPIRGAFSLIVAALA
jgi:hypothetical protein